MEDRFDVRDVEVVGHDVILTVVPPIPHDAFNPALSYSLPDSNPLQDPLGGNDVANIFQVLTNQTPAPTGSADIVSPPPPAQIDVPYHWALRPHGVYGGGKFRLLFMTSTVRDAKSPYIGDYNAFVQERAAAGHTAIRAHSGGFRVVGSTPAVDARDNTATADGRGVPIFWLNGAKVADDYHDFYDGTWDVPATERRNELGTKTGVALVFTGSRPDGTELVADGTSRALGFGDGTNAIGASSDDAGVGAGNGPLYTTTALARTPQSFYALSPVFRVDDSALYVTAVEVDSTPRNGDSYAPGEHISVLVSFSDEVRAPATGTPPTLALELGGERRTAQMHRVGLSSATFRYTVAAGDLDTDGVSIPANSLSAEASSYFPALAGEAVLDASHDLQVFPAHRVDGVAPALADAFVERASGGALTTRCSSRSTSRCRSTRRRWRARSRWRRTVRRSPCTASRSAARGCC